MNIDEILRSKDELNRKMAALLSEYERQTGVAISEISFVRREQGTFDSKTVEYVVNCFCKV